MVLSGGRGSGSGSGSGSGDGDAALAGATGGNSSADMIREDRMKPHLGSENALA